MVGGCEHEGLMVIGCFLGTGNEMSPLKQHSVFLKPKVKTQHPHKKLRVTNGIMESDFRDRIEKRLKLKSDRIFFFLCCNDCRTHSVSIYIKSISLNRPSHFFPFHVLSTTTKMWIATMEWRCFVVIYCIGCPDVHLHFFYFFVFFFFLSLSSTNSNGCMAFHSISIVLIRHTHSAILRNLLAHTRQTPSPYPTPNVCVVCIRNSSIESFQFFFFFEIIDSNFTLFPLLPHNKKKKKNILFGKKKQTKRICLLFGVCLLMKSTPWCRRLVDYTQCVCFVCGVHRHASTVPQLNRRRKKIYLIFSRLMRHQKVWLTKQRKTGVERIKKKCRRIEEHLIFLSEEHTHTHRVLFQFYAEKNKNMGNSIRGNGTRYRSIAFVEIVNFERDKY